MVKVSSGEGSKIPRGSFRSVSVLSPAFATVVVTFKVSGPSMLRREIEILTSNNVGGSAEVAGAAHTATTETARATRETRRQEENMVMKVVKGG